GLTPAASRAAWHSITTSRKQRLPFRYAPRLVRRTRAWPTSMPAVLTETVSGPPRNAAPVQWISVRLRSWGQYHMRILGSVACAVPVARNSAAIPVKNRFFVFIAIVYRLRSSALLFPHYDLRYIDEMRRIASALEAHATPRVFRPTL